MIQNYEAIKTTVKRLVAAGSKNYVESAANALELPLEDVELAVLAMIDDGILIHDKDYRLTVVA